MVEYVNEVQEQEEFRAQHEQRGLFFKNLKTHPVLKRPQRNNAGMWFNFDDYGCMEAHISELAPGGHSNRHRHGMRPSSISSVVVVIRSSSGKEKNSSGSIGKKGTCSHPLIMLGTSILILIRNKLPVIWRLPMSV